MVTDYEYSCRNPSLSGECRKRRPGLNCACFINTRRKKSQNTTLCQAVWLNWLVKRCISSFVLAVSLFSLV